MTAAEELTAAVQALVLDHQIVPCGPNPDPWYGDTPAERAEAAEAGERWGVWGGVDRQHRLTGKGHQ